MPAERAGKLRLKARPGLSTGRAQSRARWLDDLTGMVRDDLVDRRGVGVNSRSAGLRSYSTEAAKKPAMSMIRGRAHQMTSLGMAEIIAYAHRGLTRQAAKL